MKRKLILYISMTVIILSLIVAAILTYPGQDCLILFLAGTILSYLTAVFFVVSSHRANQELQSMIRVIFHDTDTTTPDLKYLLNGSDYKDLADLVVNFRSSLMQKSEYKEAQLQVLVNQINPHFLYNALESIRGGAIAFGDNAVAEMLEMLALFYRYCISQKGMSVTLKDELQNINVYVRIMQFRFVDKFSFGYTIPEGDIENLEIPKLTLQPIVENAILHGLQNYTSEGAITLRILEKDDCLNIYVQDNGAGIANDALKQLNDRLHNLSTYKPSPNERHGIALYNINRRLKLMYGQQYGLQIFSTENVGTTVLICMPKKVIAQQENG